MDTCKACKHWPYVLQALQTISYMPIVVRSASTPEPEPHQFEAGSKSAPVYNLCWPGGDGGKWMCPIARSRGDIYNEHVKFKK